MKIRQVTYFLALCEEQSFTRAAKRCGVAQPSLTRAIQLLEQEIGGRVRERTNSRGRKSDTHPRAQQRAHRLLKLSSQSCASPNSAPWCIPSSYTSVRPPKASRVRQSDFWLRPRTTPIRDLRRGLRLHLLPTQTTEDFFDACSRMAPD